MQRYWINQPSTLQPGHSLHGQNVLGPDVLGDFVTVYFTTGPVISARIPGTALSKGWCPTEKNQ